MFNLDFYPRRVLDIGANVGHWTAEARNYWPRADYLLIEANPGCFKSLMMTNEVFITALLGKEAKSDVPFYSLDKTATGASVYRELNSFYDDVEPILLNQVTLDDLLPDETFDLIKLDTQGSELDIIEGGKRIFGSASVVLMEISLKPYNLDAPCGDEVFDRMSELGFKLVERVDFQDSIQQGDYLFLRMG